MSISKQINEKGHLRYGDQGCEEATKIGNGLQG